MTFYETGAGQALGLDRMQSLPDLLCVLGAASSHHAGQVLKRCCTLLSSFGHHGDVAEYRHL